jgi:hypothetical protein
MLIELSNLIRLFRRRPLSVVFSPTPRIAADLIPDCVVLLPAQDSSQALPGSGNIRCAWNGGRHSHPEDVPVMQTDPTIDPIADPAGQPLDEPDEQPRPSPDRPDTQPETDPLAPGSSPEDEETLGRSQDRP